jgi:hypothetical protein
MDGDSAEKTVLEAALLMNTCNCQTLVLLQCTAKHWCYLNTLTSNDIKNLGNKSTGLIAHIWKYRIIRAIMCSHSSEVGMRPRN